jgi:hypothetical protein
LRRRRPIRPRTRSGGADIFVSVSVFGLIGRVARWSLVRLGVALSITFSTVNCPRVPLEMPMREA